MIFNVLLNMFGKNKLLLILNKQLINKTLTNFL